jgi:hypothetical protein
VSQTNITRAHAKSERGFIFENIYIIYDYIFICFSYIIYTYLYIFIHIYTYLYIFIHIYTCTSLTVLYICILIVLQNDNIC